MTASFDRCSLRRVLPIAMAAALALGAAAAMPPIPSDPPAAPGAFAVELVGDGRGAIATWIEPRETGAAIRFSRFDPAADPPWTAPRTVADRSDLFANWADRPAVRRLADGSLLAHDLRKIAAGTYAYGVRLSRSTDDGASWQDLGWLHDDTRAVEHGFVSMVPVDGGMLAVWLDGREMPEQAAGDGHGHGHDAAGGAMTLRTATLHAERPAPSEPVASTGLDGRVCECCATDAVLTSEGPIVVYRDRGPNEERDIFIVRRDGSRWTSPMPVARDGWIMPGCPVNGPAVDAIGAQVCVAWFTAAAGDPDDPSPPRTLAARSVDGGATFGPPLELSTTGLGRTDVVMLPSGDAIACWVDRTAPATGLAASLPPKKDRGSIALRRVRRDGSLGETVFVVPMSPGRLAGFPRLLRLDGPEPKLLLAWRDEDSDRLRAMLVEPPA